MKGQKAVIQLLNDVLCAELTAINQYVIHARMCANWRYKRLTERTHKESIEEMKHAQEIIERILFLEGTPNMQKYMKVNVGATVPDQLRNDLELEREAVKRFNDGVEACRQAGDNGSRMLLERILREEEDHIDWLEAQLHQIDELGLQNYLTEQIAE